MSVKIFSTALVFGLICIQLGYTLDCYSCTTLQNCKSPGKITCTSIDANNTLTYLALNFQGTNITNQTSNNFNCLSQQFTSAQLNLTYKGCVYDRVKACSLNPKNNNLKKQKCKQCSGKLCNPAGTFSSSVFAVVASVIVAVAMSKIFKF